MSMLMIVMGVGTMRTGVAEARIGMSVAVGNAGRIRRRMGMPMVLVVTMAVDVLQGHVFMIVLVALGQVQPHAESHQRAGDQKLGTDRLPEPRQRDGGADEGRR